MHRRGLSDVVTMVLLTLIALIALSMAWNFLQPIFKSSDVNTEVYSNTFAIPGSGISLDPNTNNLALNIERQTGSGNIAGFLVGLEDPEGRVKTFRQNITLNPFDVKRVNINYSDFTADDIVSITVTPIFKSNTTGTENLGIPTKTTVPPTSKKYKIPNGLIAYWTFDEAAGATSFADSGPSGTLTGNIVPASPPIANFKAGELGIRGNSVKFGGDPSTYLDVPSSTGSVSSPLAITFVAWIKPAVISPSQRIIYKANTLNGLRLDLAPSSLWGFRLVSASTSPTLSYSSTLGQWGQLAGTYSGGVSRLYYNGVETSSPGSGGDISSSGIPIEIGRRFNGQIDEVMIFNRVLTQTEIQSLYEAYK